MTDGTYVAPPSYIFQSQFGLVDFVAIQEEMEQLHAYCCLCMDSTSTKINQLNQDLSSYKKGGETVEDPEIGEVTSLVIDGLSEVEIPMWSGTQAFLVRAMCLLLLSSFVERSLKSLCLSFSPTGTKFKQSNKSMSKAAAYIGYLQYDCGLAFEEPANTASVREKCRVTRNDFAHGDWDAVRVGITAQSLRGAFEACSLLFREIENAYELRVVNTEIQA
ncbi:hypothetical protein [Microvirgula aerodenitrificans]|uniref:hypothetical protein n=1 Tax=Microvirgula aerodenitrificans TaxID=57480 RepID=UPI00131EF058|nr:hypothetical protein [Microvirgula aerodenitrificans]